MGVARDEARSSPHQRLPQLTLAVFAERRGTERAEHVDSLAVAHACVAMHSLDGKPGGGVPALGALFASDVVLSWMDHTAHHAPKHTLVSEPLFYCRDSENRSCHGCGHQHSRAWTTRPRQWQRRRAAAAAAVRVCKREWCVWCVVCGVWCVVCGVEGGDGVSTGQRTRMTDELVVINRPQLPASLAHPQPRHALCCHRDSDRRRRRRRRRRLAFGITGSLGGGGGVPGYLVRHFPARDAPGSASNESLCARTSRAAPAQAISSSVPLRATAHAGLRRRCHGGIRREARADATADPAILLGVPMHAVSPGMHQPRHAATCSLPPHTTRADARQHARQPLPAQGQRSRRRGSESEPLLVHGTAAQPRAPRRRADAVLHVG
jgi:hypothetical protein